VNCWNRFEQNFKHRQLRFFEKAMGREEISPREINLDKIRRILVIRQHDQLGDFLLSTPVFKALRQRCPHAFIAVVARKYTSAIAQNNQYINQVISFYEHGSDWGPCRFFDFIKRIRADFHLTIVLNTVSHSLTSDIIAWLSAAPCVLGSDHLLFKGTARNFFYNLLSPCQDEKRHQSERNLDILRYIGIDSDDAHEHLTLTAAEREWARDYFANMGLDCTTPVVIIHPGAGKIGNRWPVEFFAETGRRLMETAHVQLFVTWGPRESDMGRELLRRLQVPACYAALTDVRKVAALLAQAALFLCNDTGVMHLAAAVNTPLIAIFGPTDPDLWKPVGDSFVALRAPDHRIESIKPDTVYKTALQILNRVG
jgi:heptosyltransferase II